MHFTDHMLLQSTGIFAERHQKSADGSEMTWAVNVMAPFLLTSLLLDSVCLGTGGVELQYAKYQNVLCVGMRVARSY